MKKIAFTLLAAALLLHTNAGAQKLYPLRTIQDSVRFQLTVQGGRLTIRWLGDAPSWKKVQDFPEIRDVRLEESDLVVEYKPGKAANQSSYSLGLLHVTADDGPVVVPNSYEITEFPSGDDKENLRRYVWQDAAEALFVPGRTYTLHLRRILMGAVNCTTVRPEFTLKQQIPYYGVALAGIASSGVGLYLFKRSKQEYNQYTATWENAQTAQEAQPFRDKAVQLNKNGQYLLYSGLAITGADALLYYLKWRKIKHRQKMFDTFCAPKTTFLELRPTSNATTALGLRLTWQW